MAGKEAGKEAGKLKNGAILSKNCGKKGGNRKEKRAENAGKRGDF